MSSLTSTDQIVHLRLRAYSVALLRYILVPSLDCHRPTAIRSASSISAPSGILDTTMQHTNNLDPIHLFYDLQPFSLDTIFACANELMQSPFLLRFIFLNAVFELLLQVAEKVPA